MMLILVHAAVLCLPASTQADPGPTARGVVFEDRNADGVRNDGEPGVARVAVSNGHDVVTTDAQGRYELPIVDNVFVVKPSGWQVPLQPKTHLPQHYYSYRPEGSPETQYPGVAPTGALPDSIDFPLTRQKESKRFRIVCFGDTQPRNQQEVDFVSHDVVEELVGVDAAFGMTLGDLAYDHLETLVPIASTIGLLGLPWHHVIGNHDVNRDTKTPEDAFETYTRIFGPPYYAFNYGDVHFVALNSVMWEPDRTRYHGELGPRQLEFLANDLALVPEDHLVVLLMHIPLEEFTDKAEVLELLAPFERSLSLAAHWHRHQNFFLPLPGDEGRTHHLIVHGTACGGWWTGEPDERGIPHAMMSDGSPNGYSILTFEGNEYSLRYKAARRPASYQMNVYAPEVVATADAPETEVVVNYFTGSSKSIVRMSLDGGEWQPMEQFVGKDPGISAVKARQRELARLIARDRGVEVFDEEVQGEIYGDYRGIVGRQSPGVADIDHLWRASLPADLEPGYHLIHVHVRDMYGQEHEAHRVIRVE